MSTLANLRELVAVAVFVVLVVLVGYARFSLWRSRGGMLDRIDAMRRQPLDVEDMDREGLTGAFTFLTTIRDTYFDKPRKVRTDEDRARLAWLQATIVQLQSRYAVLGETPDAPSHEV